MKTVERYEAFDGQLFDTADACRAHEKANVSRRLVGLTQEQVDAAISRTDADLAEAFEMVGTAIARARRADGELKRERRTGAAEPPLAPGREAA